MNTKLRLVVDNTDSELEMTSPGSETLFQRLLADPCSFSDMEFDKTVALFKPRISFEVHHALFQKRMGSFPSKDSLFNRALMATINDSPDADLLISKLDRIVRIGITEVPR